MHPTKRHTAKIKNSSSTEKRELIRDVLINSAEIIRVELVFHNVPAVGTKATWDLQVLFTGVLFFIYLCAVRQTDGHMSHLSPLVLSSVGKSREYGREDEGYFNTE